MSKLPPVPWEGIGTRKVAGKKKAGLLVDLRRCTGCHACSVACKTEHNVPLGHFRTRVRYLQQPKQNVMHFLPLLCVQCEDAPCLKACPTSALEKRPDGVITVNEEKCCGNKACISACPYGAMFLNPNTQKASKCDLCSDRTDLGMEPACVDVCPTNTLVYTDWGESGSKEAQQAQQHNATGWKESAGTKSQVRYIGLESWMDGQAKSVQLEPGENEIIYEKKK